MEKLSATNRRSFLKSSALIAVPIAAVAPVAALAADDSRAKLARLEDERAIEALQRKFLRHLNGTADCGEFIASTDAVDFGEGLRSIAEDMGHEASLDLAEDGLSASTRCACLVEREAEFAGHSTLEQMTRFQGQGSHRHEARQVLATEFVKSADGWRIAGATLA
ncbi:hypothetical protein [Altererythrobacter sp. Root672]|uniref:hypothetical protein n=1 Tax=Altererythrobacter sp. Root672 TaxID=1736584 RepID=UPI0006FF734A|nr:hypothetical protein [Altererythrobacter sp. Root672]KRA83748.1 hypothetical protein ASD76_06945 [Altererythrobacter sp. Root672]